MRKITLFLLLSLLMGFGAIAQITQEKFVDFETGPSNDPDKGYSVNNTSYERLDTYQAEGNYSIRLKPIESDSVALTIANINIGGGQQAILEFYHMCLLRPDIYPSASVIGRIQVSKGNYSIDLSGQDLIGNEYIDSPFPDNFKSLNYFSNLDYNEWGGRAGADLILNNSNWRREVLNLKNAIRTLDERSGSSGGTYQIKFVVPKTKAGAAPQAVEGWYLDGVIVKRSNSEMISPNVTMLAYPAPLYYPDNLPARISAYVRDTTIGDLEKSGISRDSSYLLYKYGDEGIKRLPLVFNSTGDTFNVHIPFQGYDTLISWQLVVSDSSPNYNKRTFPWNNGWSQFMYTRSTANQDSLGKGETTGEIPLYVERYGTSQSRSYVTEFIYDDEILKKNGYFPSTINGIKFKLHRSVDQEDLNLTIKMQNATKDKAIAMHGKDPLFGDDMQTVYEGVYGFAAVENAAWMEGFINFDTEFKYTGDFLLLQVCVSTPSGALIQPLELKGIKYVDTIHAGYLNNVSCNPTGNGQKNDASTLRPDVIFKTRENGALEYDLGISAIHSPVIKADDEIQDIEVILRNYGANAVDNVVIYYKIDDGDTLSFNYTNTKGKPGFSLDTVKIAEDVFLGEGVRRIYAWTADSLGVGGNKKRDYEELNNLAYDSVFVCPGDIQGTRTIGLTENAKFSSIQDALNFMAQCGIAGNVTLDVWGGIYETEKIVFPDIQGIDSYTVTIRAQPDTNAVISFTIDESSEGALIDFANTQNIRFENINFLVKGANNRLVSLAGMSSTTGKNTDIQFKDCEFVAEAGINVIIRAMGMNRLLVDGCTFEGAYSGIILSGTNSGGKGSGNSIKNSKFLNQGETALYAKDETGILVENNEFISQNLVTSSYIVTIENCSEEPKIVSNSIYSQAGAAGIALLGVNGTSTAPALFANNMVSVVGEQAVTGVYLQKAQNLNFVYNSIRIKSQYTLQVPVAARLGVQGNALDEVIIKNNIFHNAAKGFSVHIIPTGNIKSDYNNFRKTDSDYLGMYGTGAGSLFGSLAALQEKSKQDTHSLEVNPSFLYDFNLKTYSIDLLGKGTPIPGVDKDKFDTSRDASNPCIGAFEYEQLPMNIAIDELPVSPVGGCGLENEVVSVVLKNMGKDTIKSPIIHYQVGNVHKQQQLSTDTSIAPGATYLFEFTELADLSVDNIGKDFLFDITVWAENLAGDEDTGNDTLRFSVLSLYQLPGTTPYSTTINYEESVTIDIRKERPSLQDSIYWFDEDGNQISDKSVFNTGTLYNTTNYYVAQKHEEPVLKITEIQLAASGDGLELPYPITDGSGSAITTNLAVEISNLGNKAAHLRGHKLRRTGPRAETVIFPDVVLEPKSSLVWHFSLEKVSPDSSQFIYGPRCMVDTLLNADFSFMLYRDTTIITPNNTTYQIEYFDYVKINGTRTPDTIPASIWGKNQVVATKGTRTAGIRRISNEPNASAWFLVTDELPTTLSKVEDNIIVYDPEKDCMGKKTPVTVHVQNIPLYDAVISFEPSEDRSGCNLQDEDITIKITNRGDSHPINADDVKVYYTVNDGAPVGPDTVNKNEAVAPGESVVHTFKQKADLRSYQEDKEFIIKAFIQRLADEKDRGKDNDTTLLKITSLRTPAPPVVTRDTIPFKESLLLKTEQTELRDSLQWYMKDGTLLANSKTYQTGSLEDDTIFYVRAFNIEKAAHAAINGAFVKKDSTFMYTNSNSNFNIRTSPYAAAVNNSKSQLIINASYLKKLGLSAGTISGVEFFLDSLASISSDNKVIFDEYSITLINTPRVAFDASNPNIYTEIEEEPHYSSNSLEVSKSEEKTWIRHSFDRGFEWDGESNILVQICKKPNSAYLRKVFTSTRHLITNDHHMYYSTVACNAQPNNIQLPYPVLLPNIKFVFDSYGCATDIVEKNIIIKDRPTTSAEVSAILSPIPEGNEVGDIDIKIEIRNDGINPITTVPIYWQLNNGDFHGPENWTGNLSRHETVIFPIAEKMTIDSAGYYHLKVWADMANDGNRKGDTLSIDFRVCYSAGEYLLSKTDTDADFSSFQDALNKISAAGICGNVVVKVANGNYEEQLNVPLIPGAGDGNYLKFTSEDGSNTSSILTYNGTASANYVVNIENIKGLIFDNLTVLPKDNTYARAFRIKNSQDVKLTGNNITVAALTDSLKAAIILAGSTEGVEISGNTINQSYAAVKVEKDRNVKVEEHRNLSILNNYITNFYFSAIELSGTEGVIIEGNYINTERNRVQLRGISLTGDVGEFAINKNEIILVGDVSNTGIYGIEIVNCTASNGFSLISNNMVSVKRTTLGTSAYTSIAAIRVQRSNNINIYFNTARVFPSTNVASGTSKVIELGDNSSSIRLKNNNMINANGGVALQVDAKTVLIESDYNNFYSATPTSSSSSSSYVIRLGARAMNLETWKGETNELAAGPYDAHSVQINSSLISEFNLRQQKPDLLYTGTRILEITDDIDGNNRELTPSIGAHEYIRSARDITPVEIAGSPTGNYFQEDDIFYMTLHIRNVGYENIDTIVVGIKSLNEVVSDTFFTFYAPPLLAKSESNERDIERYDLSFPIKSGYVGIDSLIIFTDIWGETTETRRNDTIRYGYEIKPGYDLRTDSYSASFDPALTGNCGISSAKMKIQVKNESWRTLEPALGKKLNVWVEIKDSTGTNVTKQIYEEEVQNWGPIEQQRQGTITLAQAFNFETKEDTTHYYKIRYAITYEGDLKSSNDTSMEYMFIVEKIPTKPIPDPEMQEPVYKEINYATSTELKIKKDAAATSYVWYDKNMNVVGNDIVINTGILESTTMYRVVAKSKGGCPGDTLDYEVRVRPQGERDARPINILWPKDSLVYTHSDTIIINFKNDGRTNITSGSDLWLAYSVVDARGDEVSSGRELFQGTVGTGDTMKFAFSKLAEFPTEGGNYYITVYTDLKDDNSRNNDTIYNKVFKPGNSSIYCEPQEIVNYWHSTNGIDISEVSFGTSENKTPPVGNKYTDFTKGSNQIPMFEVYKGVEQILSITPASTMLPAKAEEQVRGWMKVYIDWNRNGIFEVDKDEEVLSKACTTGIAVIDTIIIPDNYLNGAMKMRVVVTADVTNANDADKITPCRGGTKLNNGEVEDYKLFVRFPYNVNATLSAVTSPQQVLTNSNAEVKVMLHNTGRNDLTGAVIKYQFDTAAIQTYNVTEPLPANTGREISLGTHTFKEGKNLLSAWVEVNNDENPLDDSLSMNIYLPPTRSVTYRNDFSTDGLEFIAPEGPNFIDRNLWQKDSLWRIERASEPSDRGGNISYLYSPIFDISEVKPDSLSFDLSRKLQAGSRMYVEYLNKSFEWVLLGSANNDSYGTNWYDDVITNSFTGEYVNYRNCVYSLFNEKLAETFGNIFQIRFVFVTTAEAPSEYNYVRIDNFALLRAASLIDMEVLSVVSANTSSYGQDYYPIFVLKNSGTLDVDECKICYSITPPSTGNFIEKCFVWKGNLKYEETDTVYTRDYNAPPIRINHNMGDTITLCVYSKYEMEDKPENDTACIDIKISKMQNDLAMRQIIYPLEYNAVPSVSPVTVRIENFGSTFRKNATVFYRVDNDSPVSATIDLVELLGGNGLEPGDSIDFTFPDSLVFDSYGKMMFTAYVGEDGYAANNTLTKYLHGVSSLSDIKAERIVLNAMDDGEIEVQLEITNVGSTGVQGFGVAYYFTMLGITSPVFTDTLWRERPIAASKKEYHIFKDRLKVEGVVIFDEFCAFVYDVLGDNNKGNDTTCAVIFGQVDMSPTMLVIEEDPLDSKCRMMLEGENKGTLAVNELSLSVIADGVTHTMSFNDYQIGPGEKFGILLDGKIDKKEKYDILAIVNAGGDVNRSNDTTSKYRTTPLIVGIDDADSLDIFRVEQNYPNPFTENTEFKFYIPTGENVRIFVINNQGQTLISEEKFYGAGEHIYRISNKNFASGVYFYGVEYKGQRLVKKMIYRK